MSRLGKQRECGMTPIGGRPALGGGGCPGPFRHSALGEIGMTQDRSPLEKAFGDCVRMVDGVTACFMLGGGERLRHMGC